MNTWEEHDKAYHTALRSAHERFDNMDVSELKKWQYVLRGSDRMPAHDIVASLEVIHGRLRSEESNE